MIQADAGSASSMPKKRTGMAHCETLMRGVALFYILENYF